MKDEFTEKMHSEFTISEEEEISNRVGSAIQAASILKVNKKKEFEEILKGYTVGLRDYLKWKEHWSRLGLRIDLL
ncbi:MAG: hypothetical protein J6V20_02565 [Bacteroidaceae bacterium]|nr:hypothetical protein [Bacteroidaceae bacterium]